MSRENRLSQRDIQGFARGARATMYLALKPLEKIEANKRRLANLRRGEIRGEVPERGIDTPNGETHELHKTGRARDLAARAAGISLDTATKYIRKFLGIDP